MFEPRRDPLPSRATSDHTSNGARGAHMSFFNRCSISSRGCDMRSIKTLPPITTVQLSSDSADTATGMLSPPATQSEKKLCGLPPKLQFVCPKPKRNASKFMRPSCSTPPVSSRELLNLLSVEDDDDDDDGEREQDADGFEEDDDDIDCGIHVEDASPASRAERLGRSPKKDVDDDDCVFSIQD